MGQRVFLAGNGLWVSQMEGRWRAQERKEAKRQAKEDEVSYILHRYLLPRLSYALKDVPLHLRNDEEVFLCYGIIKKYMTAEKVTKKLVNEIKSEILESHDHSTGGYESRFLNTNFMLLTYAKLLLLPISKRPFGWTMDRLHSFIVLLDDMETGKALTEPDSLIGQFRSGVFDPAAYVNNPW